MNLFDNLSGFLVTCNGNEYKCLLEAYNICNDTAEKLYGPQEAKCSENEAEIEAEIRKEIEQLNSRRRFIQVKTKCKNVLFIRSNDSQVDCTKMMEHILSDIELSQQQNARYLQRFIPVQATFKAEQEKLGSNLEANFDQLASKQAMSYAVHCRVRNNSSVNSEKLLLEQIVLIVKIKRPNWYLNLSEPNILISLNVVQKAACLSLITDYHKYSKYNLVEYFRKCHNSKQSVTTDGDNVPEEEATINPTVSA